MVQISPDIVRSRLWYPWNTIILRVPNSYYPFLITASEWRLNHLKTSFELNTGSQTQWFKGFNPACPDIGLGVFSRNSG